MHEEHLLMKQNFL